MENQPIAELIEERRELLDTNDAWLNELIEPNFIADSYRILTALETELERSGRYRKGMEEAVCLLKEMDCECGYETGSDSSHEDATCYPCQTQIVLRKALSPEPKEERGE